MDEGRIEPTGEGECRIVGTLSLETVPDLREQGVAWLRQAPQQCRFDLSTAIFDGSAGVALLIAWLRDARGAGRELSFVNPPAKLVGIARISGTGELLNLGAEG